MSSPTVTTPSVATTQPSRPIRSTITSSGSRIVAVHLEAAALELGEGAVGERGAHLAAAPCRAWGRAPAGSASPSAPRPRPRRTRRALIRSSSAISSAWPAASGAPATIIRAQRLPQLEPGGRPRLPAELDNGADLSDLGEQGPIGLGHLGPAREVDRRARAPRRGSTRDGRRGTASPARRPAATGRARTRASRSASSSSTQKRLRDRRMYQFDRSSTNASNARITFTVSVAS